VPFFKVPVETPLTPIFNCCGSDSFFTALAPAALLSRVISKFLFNKFQ
jgi:hypothetical protein